MKKTHWQRAATARALADLAETVELVTALIDTLDAGRQASPAQLATLRRESALSALYHRFTAHASTVTAGERRQELLHEMKLWREGALLHIAAHSRKRRAA